MLMIPTRMLAHHEWFDSLDYISNMQMHRAKTFGLGLGLQISN